MNSILLKDEVVNVGERGADTFQQQVERLKSRHLLSRVLTAGAQRQTEVELRYEIYIYIYLIKWTSDGLGQVEPF